MPTWNFNIDEAPKSYSRDASYSNQDGKIIQREKFVPVYVWLATKCGKVTVSYWIPNEKRWNMLAQNEKPMAWQPYPIPVHPDLETVNA